MERPYPNEELDQRVISLLDYVTTAFDLHSAAAEDGAPREYMEDFLRFALAGRYKEDGESDPQRIILNPFLNLHPPRAGHYNISRDIDSAIGYTSDLPFSVPFAVFIIARFEDTLTDQNHLFADVEYEVRPFFLDGSSI
jgi:hypothetical protein